MPETVNAWLAVFGAIGGFLSALIVWGFASGRFIQKRTDDFDGLEKSHSALDERVNNIDVALDEVLRSIHKLREENNVSIGKVQLTYELLAQRVEHQKERVEEWRRQIDERARRLEEQILSAQRLIDSVAGRVRRHDHDES